jgi:hypothetical protein
MSTDPIPPVPPGKATGLIPRDYKSYPPGYLACAPVAPYDWLVPQSEQADRLAAQQAARASLYDIRMAYYSILKSLDQNGFGLCWFFSTTKAAMYIRAIMGLPPVILSAWWGAGQIKNWRDEGGWGSASLEFFTKHGTPALEFCPKYSRSAVQSGAEENAALHKVTEWYDGTEDRDQNKQIMISAFLLGLPPVLDYNWLGHSMCGCRLVSLDPLTIDCDNSWGEIGQYGEKGLYRITGSRAIPDAVVVPRVSVPSTA